MPLPLRRVAETVEEVGLLADLGLPEVDELLIPPGEIARRLKLPTPRDLIIAIRDLLLSPLERMPRPPPPPIPPLPWRPS